jgi:hypothetical protein
MSAVTKKKSVVVYPQDSCILKEGVELVIQRTQEQILTASDHAVKQELQNKVARCHNLLTLLNTDHPDDEPASKPSDT